MLELKQEPAKGDRALTGTEREDPIEDAATRRILCAACRHPVTSTGERIEVAGRHQHHQVNQHGYAFHLGCFGAAPGAIGAGPATGEWTWFAGTTWQLAHCRGCARHIGWLYRSPARVFWGLILDRLLEEPAPPPG
jgi:hypothetical protein